MDDQHNSSAPPASFGISLLAKLFLSLGLSLLGLIVPVVISVVVLLKTVETNDRMNYHEQMKTLATQIRLGGYNANIHFFAYLMTQSETRLQETQADFKLLEEKLNALKKQKRAMHKYMLDHSGIDYSGWQAMGKIRYQDIEETLAEYREIVFSIAQRFRGESSQKVERETLLEVMEISEELRLVIGELANQEDLSMLNIAGESQAQLMRRKQILLYVGGAGVLLNIILIVVIFNIFRGSLRKLREFSGEIAAGKTPEKPMTVVGDDEFALIAENLERIRDRCVSACADGKQSPAWISPNLASTKKDPSPLPTLDVSPPIPKLSVPETPIKASRTVFDLPGEEAGLGRIRQTITSMAGVLEDLNQAVGVLEQERESSHLKK